MAPTTPHHPRGPIVISGPSGSGKSTILSRLFTKYPTLFGFSISHTTRQPRGTEQNGVEYHFVSVEEFEGMVGQEKFVEHAQFGKNRYGTSVGAVEAVEKEGEGDGARTCVLDIEMEGVKQIHKHPTYGKITRFLFLSPPSPEVLEQRLRGRGTDKEEAIQGRLEQAVREMEYSKTPGVHDKIVINDDLDRAWEEVEAWIFEGREGEMKED